MSQEERGREARRRGSIQLSLSQRMEFLEEDDFEDESMIGGYSATFPFPLRRLEWRRRSG